MKLLAVSKDSRYLYIETDQGRRKQSLNWHGVDALEAKCRSLIGYQIGHSTLGSWDPDVWFQEVYMLEAQVPFDTLPSTNLHSTELKFDSQTVRRIYGPPGTGKTTELIKITTDAVSKGTNISDIGYFAYTNIAADEALNKVIEKTGKSKADFTGFSTLHSLATRIGGSLGKALCSRDDLNKFDNQIGAEEVWMKAGDVGSVVVRPIHPVLDAISLQLATMDTKLVFDEVSISKTSAKLASFFQLSEETINTDIYSYSKKYCEAYLQFKHINNLADFNDVIVNVVSDDFPENKIPSFELLIIDEAQDLSKLQWKLVEKLQKKANNTVLAGDDDQAIMEGFGASPTTFNEFPVTEADTVLSVSYRVPSKIKEFVDTAIMPRLVSQSKSRKQKEWHENPNSKGEGVVTTSFVDTKVQGRKIIQVVERLNMNALIQTIAKSPQQDWLIMAPTKGTCARVSAGLKALNVGHYLQRKDVLDAKSSDVKIQSVHTSKGMGAKKVAFIIFSKGDHRMVSRDVRLMYVAVTRATQDLYLVVVNG